MTTFIIGLVILLGGAALYGRFCEKVFGPDDRKTPAYTKEDGVDFVPMRGWKNSLINLLNIAGTGPILGPIQGILFGPIAFLTIPIGNVIGGAMHDYFSGMICLRDGGTQMPEMIRRYSTKGIYKFYNVFVCVLLLLVGAVFIYTPGDIAATQLLGFDGKATSVSTWVIYGVIFLYYLIATVFPIDAIIGKIYPIFGGILLFIGTAASGIGLQAIPDRTTLGNLVMQALVPTVITTLALVRAIKHKGSTLTSVLGAMEPVTAVCVGITIFGEPLTRSIALGILLIISAVTVIILKR